MVSDIPAGDGKISNLLYSVTYIVLIVLQKEPSFAPFVSKIDSAHASTGRMLPCHRENKD